MTRIPYTSYLVFVLWPAGGRGFAAPAAVLWLAVRSDIARAELTVTATPAVETSTSEEANEYHDVTKRLVTQRSEELCKHPARHCMYTCIVQG